MIESPETKTYRCLNRCDDYQSIRTNNPFAKCGRCGSQLMPIVTIQGRNMRLIDMMDPREDFRTEIVLRRAINQISHALYDHGLIVVVDHEGNFGVDYFYRDQPIQDEPICTFLRRLITYRAQQNRPLTAIRISDEDARKLAAELADFQFNRKTTEADIYAGFVAGGSRFMDLPVTVIPS